MAERLRRATEWQEGEGSTEGRVGVKLTIFKVIKAPCCSALVKSGSVNRPDMNESDYLQPWLACAALSGLSEARHKRGCSSGANLQRRLLRTAQRGLPVTERSRDLADISAKTRCFQISFSSVAREFKKTPKHSTHNGRARARTTGMSANSTNLSQISSLSNHISRVAPSKALLICVCVCLMCCHCSSQWMSIKTVQPGSAKPPYLPDASSAHLCLLPPRPKLPPPFGLPKPPLAGRLVDGQESASQGRPWSPAFSNPGRLWQIIWRETKGSRTQLNLQSPSLANSHLISVASSTNWCDKKLSWCVLAAWSRFVQQAGT